MLCVVCNAIDGSSGRGRPINGWRSGRVPSVENLACAGSAYVAPSSARGVLVNGRRSACVNRNVLVSFKNVNRNAFACSRLARGRGNRQRGRSRVRPENVGGRLRRRADVLCLHLHGHSVVFILVGSSQVKAVHRNFNIEFTGVLLFYLSGANKRSLMESLQKIAVRQIALCLCVSLVQRKADFDPVSFFLHRSLAFGNRADACLVSDLNDCLVSVALGLVNRPSVDKESIVKINLRRVARRGNHKGVCSCTIKFVSSHVHAASRHKIMNACGQIVWQNNLVCGC